MHGDDESVHIQHVECRSGVDGDVPGKHSDCYHECGQPRFDEFSPGRQLCGERDRHPHGLQYDEHYGFRPRERRNRHVQRDARRGQPAASGTCNLTSTTAGAKTITATYPTGTDYNGSAGTASHTVNKANTTTTISNGASLSTTPTVVGQSYSVNVSVARVGSTGAPSGSVTVSDGSASCIASVAGSGGTSTGSCSLTSTSAGSKTVTATYGGDSNFNGSASSGVSHTVNKAATTTTISSDLPDPSVVGETVDDRLQRHGRQPRRRQPHGHRHHRRRRQPPDLLGERGRGLVPDRVLRGRHPRPDRDLRG